jgi:hypothetical protein|tara:strand:+ start:358 stop:777 length:420 start_codon:yes stop_codon:yes gene_type:complete
MIQRYLEIDQTWEPLQGLHGDSSKPLTIYDDRLGRRIERPTIGQWLVFTLHCFNPDPARNHILSIDESMLYTQIKHELDSANLSGIKFYKMDEDRLNLIIKLIHWIYPMHRFHEEGPRMLRMISESVDQLPDSQLELVS